MVLVRTVTNEGFKMELLNFWNRDWGEVDLDELKRLTHELMQRNYLGYEKSVRPIDTYIHKIGKKTSRIIATLKRSNIDTSNHLENEKLKLVCSYLRFISKEYDYQVLNKLEPALYEARQKYRTGAWIELPISQLFEGQGLDIRAWNELNCLHHLHFSTVDPTLIAYYPSLKHLREGREVRTRFGKYVSKFSDILFEYKDSIDQKIKIVVDRFLVSQSSELEYEIEYYSDDEDQAQNWHDVYFDTRNFKSCMSDNENIGFNYCTGFDQIFLAVVRSKINGSVISRCIVRKHSDNEKNRDGGLIRIYPSKDESHPSNFLYHHLKDIGYIGYVDFEGLYLRTCEDLSAPYLDGSTNTAELKKIDGKSYFLVMCDGEYLLDQTSGYCEQVDVYYCAGCDDQVPEDDLTNTQDGDMCESCLTNNYVIDRDGDTIHRDEAIYCESDGNYYHEDTNAIYYSEYHDGYYFEEDLKWNIYRNDYLFVDLPIYFPDLDRTQTDQNFIPSAEDGGLLGDLYILPNGEYIFKRDKDYYLTKLNIKGVDNES